MYCKASAPLAITSASRITLMHNPNERRTGPQIYQLAGGDGKRIPYNRGKSEIRMRRVWRAGVIGALGASCLALWPAAAAPAAQLALHECRLEHPLLLASIAARCGVLKVPEDRTQPGGATIDLSVAVVPALNRRSRAAP